MIKDGWDVADGDIAFALIFGESCSGDERLL
jgi:hypothetical protein